MAGIKLSILDRIIGSNMIEVHREETNDELEDRPDDDADRQQRVHRETTIKELKDAIRSDLTFLLYTWRVQEPVRPIFKEACESILTYGLPDFTSSSVLDPAEQDRIRREIENAIRIFEPRLSSVTVSLDRSAKGSEQVFPTVLRYHVR